MTDALRITLEPKDIEDLRAGRMVDCVVENGSKQKVLIQVEPSSFSYKNGRKAARITVHDLERLIQKTLDEGRSVASLTQLTPKIEHDIGSKVSFDVENEDIDPCNYGPWKDLLGYRQWGDLTFLGGSSGGDWEQPVFWIIYYDGKHLRGYVPKDGNVYNHVTKEALGNDDDADEAFVRKIGWLEKGVQWSGAGCFDNYDVDKIRQDVLKRITVVK